MASRSRPTALPQRTPCTPPLSLGLRLALAALLFACISPTPALSQQVASPTPQSVPASAPAQRELAWHQDLDTLTAAMKAKGFRIEAGIATRGQVDFAKLYPNWDADVASLNAGISTLPDSEVFLRLIRLMASAHVAHNIVHIPLGMGFVSRLPFGLRWFPEGLFITAATPEYSSALGARIVTIGGKPPEQLLADLAPYISHENDIELRVQSPNYIPARGVLDHFQLIDANKNVSLQLVKPTGETLDLNVPVTDQNPPLVSIVDALHLPVPLFRSRPDEHSYYWYQYVSDSQTLYIQYNQCENDPKQSFHDFTQKLLADADTQSIKRVVIDLRKNGGGDSRVIDPLKGGLASRRNSFGPVYLLIGPATFSSAIDDAVDLHKSLSAPLVGEPTGGMPDGYGEVRYITLPNSKLVVQLTTKHWDTKAGSPLTLTPDIPAPYTFADLLAGRDPSLEAAIHSH